MCVTVCECVCECVSPKNQAKEIKVQRVIARSAPQREHSGRPRTENKQTNKWKAKRTETYKSWGAEGVERDKQLSALQHKLWCEPVAMLLTLLAKRLLPVDTL